MLLPQVQQTESMLDRFRGLLSSPQPNSGEGLLLSPCNSIHMFFMSYPLDIVFIDRDGKIISRRENLRPWRMAGERKATTVLECRAGEIARLGLKDGEEVEWRASE